MNRKKWCNANTLNEGECKYAEWTLKWQKNGVWIGDDDIPDAWFMSSVSVIWVFFIVVFFFGGSLKKVELMQNQVQSNNWDK